jgi:xylulokinase
MAALLNGASCLDWVAALLGEPDHAALVAEAEARASRPSPVRFLPYLSGERSPINDADARGAFANLDHATGALDLVQAVLEGVAFALIDGFNAFGQGADRESILPIVGGGARSRYWTKVIASALGRPLARVADAGTSAASGAARLARLALTGEPVSAVCLKPPVEEIVTPDRALNEAYTERFLTFRRLYRELKSVREATADRPPAAIP